MIRPLALRLPETQHGRDWINQFDKLDQDLARQMLESLVLVSGIEFERQLAHLLDETARNAAGPTAFFAVREWPDPSTPYLKEDEESDAVGPGGDIGSEGRIAAIVRGMCRVNRSQLLNHPSIRTMRESNCRLIVLVDDFVGSGDRVAEFYAALWSHPTIRSWHSHGLIRLMLVAYSATSRGERRVAELLDFEMRFVRGCPTFHDLPISRSERSLLLAGFRKYAKLTQYAGIPFGYNDTGAALVFEHGCPDNAPVIFWAEAGGKKSWKPIFPARSVVIGNASTFPPELAIAPAAAVLRGVGQIQLSRSSALSRRGPIGAKILVLLGLMAKRIRKRSLLSHASGLTIEECTAIIERCIAWKFLTPALNLTARGNSELYYSRRMGAEVLALPKLGSDEYYPKQLRGSGRS
jgi:hypothetical protein